MANLIVELDCEFTASKLMWLKNGRTVPLKPAELKKDDKRL